MRKIVLIVVFIQLYIGLSFSQVVWECKTNSNAPDILKTILPEDFVSPRNTYTIGVYVHIIRKSDGGGGVSESDVNDAISEMLDIYSLHQIYFCINEINEIRNDYIYFNLSYQQLIQSLLPNGKYSILNNYSNTNGIDIFFFPDDNGLLFSTAFASGIPGTNVILGGLLLSGTILAHELGHCLGLYHTFHGLCESGCPELVDGSNCNDCGDYVCDTPPDPVMRFFYNCIWTGTTCNNISDHDINGDLYLPDPYNIMSYATECYQYFTIGQSDRMKSVISNSQILQSTLIPESYHLYNQTLYSSNSYYYCAQNEVIIEETIIQLYSSTEVKSWNSILIKPGTQIKPGASFHAYIQQCLNPLSFKKEGNVGFENLDGVVKTHLEEQNKEHITIFPNPSKGEFKISIQDFSSENIEVELYDIHGKKMLNDIVKSENIIIKTDNYKPGVYFIRVTADNENFSKTLIFE